MRSLRDLLAGLSLPPAASASSVGSPTGGPGAYAMPAAHLLGGDLPQGHVHVWSGPPGAGKTAFLLGLLLDAARRNRGTCLATYDLPAASVALRVLAIESGVPLADLDRGQLTPAEATAVARARARLEALPFFVLEARGFPVTSLADRCVRWTRRIDVLGVDYAEAVVRPAGSPIADTFRDLSALAKQRWMAVVAVARTSPLEHPAQGGSGAKSAPADRVGWIDASPDRPAAEASVVANRHGATPSCRLRLDPSSGRWLPADPPATA
ncbi:MAG: DnaB-like helicase C-terminal domain-containing protein [Planctomycetota bacterium]